MRQGGFVCVYRNEQRIIERCSAALAASFIAAASERHPQNVYRTGLPVPEVEQVVRDARACMEPEQSLSRPTGAPSLNETSLPALSASERRDALRTAPTPVRTQE